MFLLFLISFSNNNTRNLTSSFHLCVRSWWSILSSLEVTHSPDNWHGWPTLSEGELTWWRKSIPYFHIFKFSRYVLHAFPRPTSLISLLISHPRPTPLSSVSITSLPDIYDDQLKSQNYNSPTSFVVHEDFIIRLWSMSFLLIVLISSRWRPFSAIANEFSRSSRRLPCKIGST